MKVISIDTTEVKDLSIDLGNAVIKGAIKDGNIFKCNKFDNKLIYTLFYLFTVVFGRDKYFSITLTACSKP